MQFISLNYFIARQLYKPPKCQSKCVTIWLANRVGLQISLHSPPLVTAIMQFGFIFTTV